MRYQTYFQSHAGSSAYLIYDTETDKVVSQALTMQTCMARLRKLEPHLTPKEAKAIISDSQQVELEYDVKRGLTDPKIYPRGAELIINLYEKPEWRTKGAVAEWRVGAYVMPFLKHLFNGDDAVIEKVLDWMGVMVQAQRNGVILCLIGQQGVGKGLFGDLCRSLVGPNYDVGSTNSNWTKVNVNTFRGTHNGVLKYKQFVHFEEAYVRGPEQIEIINAIKRLNTDAIQIRSMYREATVAENHASFMLCSNHYAAIPYERNQRRFWTVGITKTRVQDSQILKSAMFDPQKYGSINAAIKDTLLHPATIRALGHMLMERKCELMLCPPDVGDRCNEILNLWDAQPRAYKTIFTYHKLQGLKTGQELSHIEFERLLQSAAPRYGANSYQVTQEVVLDIVDLSGLYHKYILSKHPTPYLELIENEDRTYKVIVKAGVPDHLLAGFKVEHEDQKGAEGRLVELTKQRRST